MMMRGVTDPARAPQTATLVARYAERFNAALVDGSHTVTSPLGAWLLLALVAPAARGADRTRLEDLLGTDADDAFGRAAELLETPHPAAPTACALWARREHLLAAFSAWSDTLPKVVEVSGAPTRANADAWAKRSTKGLIDHFPLELGDDSPLVFANALATRVKWKVPFTLVPAAMLGGEWGTTITRALSAPSKHRMCIARTDAAGDVGVHAARSADGLLVASVIGAPDVDEGAVLAAAHDVVGLILEGASTAAVHSLFDLPLDAGHAWTIREQRKAGAKRDELFEAFLPAWSASSRHELADTDVDVGFSEGLATLRSMCSPERSETADAVQIARAAFGVHGFEAAAVTAMLVRAAAPLPAADELARTATIRFDRPYAVVAVAVDRDRRFTRRPRGRSPWNGVPVFSAWVAEPTEA